MNYENNVIVATYAAAAAAGLAGAMAVNLTETKVAK